MTRTNSMRFLIWAGAIFVAPMLVATYAGCARTTKTEPIALTDTETQTAKEFEVRVTDYATLQQKLEATLPALPEKATPEQIEQHRQTLGALTKTARKDAKQGEFFTPDMVALVKRALAETLSGTNGTSLASIMDDNPGLLDASVNDRYPVDAPVTSMPIQLLETLPKLPETLEYRFLGKRLVLVCSPAQMVLDLTPNVLP